MTEVEKSAWRRVVAEEGSKHHLMPALLEYFDDELAKGTAPDEALKIALASCEIGDVLAET